MVQSVDRSSFLLRMGRGLGEADTKGSRGRSIPNSLIKIFKDFFLKLCLENFMCFIASHVDGRAAREFSSWCF